MGMTANDGVVATNGVGAHNSVWTETVPRFQTTDATPTVAWSFAIPTDSIIALRVGSVCFLHRGDTGVMGVKIVDEGMAGIRNEGGACTAFAFASPTFAFGGNATLNTVVVAFAASGTTAQLTVTGIAATTIDWDIMLEVQLSSSFA
jgi:hypothetical protein